MTWLLAILSFTSLMLYKVQATHMSTACGLESVNWFPSKPGMLWNSSPEKGGGIACKKSAIIRVIRHNWMLQGSFNSIFSPANICYGGDGIRTWNEEGVSRCTLFSSQVSQYTTDGLERARDKTALLKQLLPSLLLHRQALGSMH